MVQISEQKAFGGRGDRLYHDPGLLCLQAMFLCTLVYITVGVCGYTAFKERYHLCSMHARMHAYVPCFVPMHLVHMLKSHTRCSR